MVNKWIGIGNLGQDPEVRSTPGGQSVCNFRIACSEKWKDKDGNMQDRTEWVSVVAWGKLGEIVGRFCTKGKQVYVEGRLTTRKWHDKEGNDRYTTEIVASEVKFLGGKGDEGRSETRNETRGRSRDDAPPSYGDDEVPF